MVDLLEQDQKARDEYWMRQAIDLAKCADVINEVPVGALLVAEGKRVGSGWNQPISTNDPTAHAEIVAIREAAKTLKNYRMPNTTLYVTIEPCTMCFGAIVHARIARVVFGAPEPKAGVFVSNENLRQASCYNHYYTWEGGVCEKECAELIQVFFQRRREEKKSFKL